MSKELDRAMPVLTGVKWALHKVNMRGIVFDVLKRQRRAGESDEMAARWASEDLRKAIWDALDTVTEENILAPSWTPEQAKFLEEIRTSVVLAIAFLGRDNGTARAERTVPEVIAELVKADKALIAAQKGQVPVQKILEPETVTVRPKPYAAVQEAVKQAHKEAEPLRRALQESHKRNTFTVPPGWKAERESDGRATGYLIRDIDGLKVHHKQLHNVVPLVPEQIILDPSEDAK